MENKHIQISIIIPIFNEEKTIIQVLERISKVIKPNVTYETIVINDGSTDGTLSLLEKNKNLYDQLISYEKNYGKGNAVNKGLNISNGQYIFFQDADLEYDPIEINKFLDLINRFQPDLIIGSRLNYSEYTRSHNILNKFGNMFITLIFNLFYNTTFTDIYSCYACYKKDLLDPNYLKTKGFEQHAEILCKVVKNGDKFYEVPISYNGRNHAEGKKIRFYHIFSVLFRIIIERF
ncbi:glycosyltransferase family 2 protein [Candidatus Pelagibacter sp.]|nr:glycosyltransferase family 2 protein [Candidatus Pelagibacter sp.]|tara:strand:- start:113 stop:814 length:702 start_codon:yes stop_codon:yes gene_type:complete